jgi:hypothetical protein
MKQPCTEQRGESAVYTCMLWSVQSGVPTVVTIQDEHQDRWIGRRCVVASSSFEAPLEMFMKSDWRRTEPPVSAEPREAMPGGPAAAIAAAGAAAAARKRSKGFHP